MKHTHAMCTLSTTRLLPCRFDYWENTFNFRTKKFERVKRTRWERPAQAQELSLGYYGDRPDITCVYAAFTYGRDYVQAVKIPEALAVGLGELGRMWVEGVYVSVPFRHSVSLDTRNKKMPAMFTSMDM